MKQLIKKHWDFLAYAVFGVLTTLVNIATYAVCSGKGLSTGVANIIAWVMAVLFAYITNRKWVFKSQHSTPGEIAKEFLSFIVCRLGTGVIDQIIMVVGVDYIGPRLHNEEILYIWGLALKVVSNVIVILLNYIFSKMVIFKKSEEGK